MKKTLVSVSVFALVCTVCWIAYTQIVGTNTRDLAIRAGPVALVRIPEAFVGTGTPVSEARGTSALPVIVDFERPDGVDLGLAVTQEDSSFDDSMGQYFGIRAPAAAEAVERNGVEWTYEIRDLGFAATTVVDGARVRLFSQVGSWTDQEIVRLIGGVVWRETNATELATENWRHAITTNDPESIERLTRRGFQTDTLVDFVFPEDDERSHVRASGLAVAAAVSDAAMVRRLLVAGADPNQLDSRGFTPVLVAAEAGNSEALRVLLESGGDPNRRDPSGRAPIQVALVNHHAKVVEVLIAGGADIDIQLRDSGFSSLMEAARLGQVDAARVLIEGGSSIEARARDGATALHFAASHGRVDLLRLLVAAGADTSAVTNAGATALTVAPRSCDVETVQYLLDLGLDPNAGPAGKPPDVGGSASRSWSGPPDGSALSEAVQRRCPPVARVLLDAGARVDPVALAYARKYANEPAAAEILAMFDEVLRRDGPP